MKVGKKTSVGLKHNFGNNPINVKKSENQANLKKVFGNKGEAKGRGIL